MSKSAPEDRLVVGEASDQRLDRYLAERLGRPRAQIKRLFDAGLITLNGQIALPSQLPRCGDIILVREPPPAVPQVPTAAADGLVVLYEDDDLLVIDKPAGIAIHAGAGTAQITVADLLAAYDGSLLTHTWPNPSRAGIVHRLDKDTSGVLVLARTPDMQAALQALFAARQLHKEYVALVHGHLQTPAGMIDAPIGRHPTERVRRSIVAAGSGRSAQTRYRVLEPLVRASLLSLQPLTGRTHQIRVHLAAIGHPVLGDTLYAFKRSKLVAERQMLHARELAFVHPCSQRELRVAAPLPADFLCLLEALREEA